MTLRIAALFPGQGAYLPGVLHERIELFPAVQRVLDTVDSVAAEYGQAGVSSLLLERDAPSLEELLDQDTEILDLAILAINAAAHAILTSSGVHADVLAGHSFGELVALSAAGTLSVADVTRLACDRIAAFQKAGPPDGGLLALEMAAQRAEQLVRFLGDPRLCVAIDNGPQQAVISGPTESLAAAERLVAMLGIRATRLRASYAFHNRLLYPTADLFIASAADLVLREPRVPVFSPILGRYVTTPADARAVIERNLLAPVKFYEGLLTLFRDGTRIFIEAGARQAITGIVKASLPPCVTAISLLPSRGYSDTFAETLIAAGVPMSRTTPAVKEHEGPGDTEPHITDPTPEPQGSTLVGRAAPDTQNPELAAPQPASVTQRVQATDRGAGRLPPRPALLAELAEVYADQLGFPAEMLTADIDLEADLGVDSAKQLALFERTRQRYGTPEPPTERRVQATTLERIAELLEDLGR